MVFELKPHQEEAVKKMHNGCILCGGVGVGKSHTAVGYYLENEVPRDVVVITTANKRNKFDWQELFGEVGMISDPELTMGSVVEVDSWNNIDKYKDRVGQFFIFDEQRLVGTGAWVKAFYKIAANNHWVMLSATPGDTWLDYVPVFRANGFIKNITKFRDEHVIMRWTGRYHQVIGYRQVGQLVRWRNQILVMMPYEKHTKRHSHDVWVDYDKELVKELVNKRWHVFENRPLADASELFRVMRKVVYSDDSRLLAVRHLLEKHPKLIVFYNFDFELEILRKGLQQDSGTSQQPRNSTETCPSDLYERCEKDSTARLNLSKRSTVRDGLIGTIWEDGFCETCGIVHDSQICPNQSFDGIESNTLSPETGKSGLQKTYGSSSKTMQDPTVQLFFETVRTNDEWSTKTSPFLPESTTESISYESVDDTSTTDGSIERRETSQSKTSIEPSSMQSSKSSDPSLTGRKSMHTPQFQVAEWNGHKHEPVPTTTSWIYLVQYVAGAEAWECTETDAICFYSMPYSYKYWHQAHGRIDRLTTSFLDLHYYRLISRAPIDYGVARSLSSKRSFNEKAFGQKMGIF